MPDWNLNTVHFTVPLLALLLTIASHEVIFVMTQLAQEMQVAADDRHRL